jgi:uncharacterized protein (TIGR02391 family)
VYRTQHEDWLDLLDGLEKQRYLRRDTEGYRVTLLGLSVIDAPEVDDLLGDCEKLYPILRSGYKEDPRQDLRVGDIAALAHVSGERAVECLRYMVEGPIWSTYNLNAPDPATTSVRPAEAILKYRTFREVIQEVTRWRANDSIQDIQTVMARMAGRRAQSAAEEQRPGVEPVLGVEQLHAKVAQVCGPLIQSGHYDNAVGNGLKLIETYVREAIGAGPSLLGVKLMEKAFSGKDPVLRVRDVQAEQEGVHLLFRGAVAAFKNPHSHRFVPVADLVVAMEHLAFVSLLLRLVDEAKARRVET